MDSAHIRRGLPTAQIRYGQDVAVLAAVTPLSKALRLVAKATILSAELCLQLVVVLSRAVDPDGLAKGQYLDVHNTSKARDEHDIASVNGENPVYFLLPQLVWLHWLAMPVPCQERRCKPQLSTLGRLFSCVMT